MRPAGTKAAVQDKVAKPIRRGHRPQRAPSVLGRPRAQIALLSLALLAATALPLSSCAARSVRAPEPTHASAGRREAPDHGVQPPHREGAATLLGWERRQQAHLRALVGLVRITSAPPGGRTQRFTPLPPPAGPRPSPGATAPRPTSRQPGAAPSPPSRAPTRRTHVARGEARGRCRRICRHVAAICYAARRICTIAAALAEPDADAACSRGRSRCAEARTLARSRCNRCQAD